MPIDRRPRLLVGWLVAAAAMAGSACATSSANSRPSAFPTAPRAPVSFKEPADPTLGGPIAAGVSAIVSDALSLRGTKYRLGGQDPRGGLDCSGLVRYVFAQHHVVLPRTVDEQFATGQPVDFDRIRAGDLLFFATTPAGLRSGSATHVGIALGAPDLGEFVHAPGSGGSVRIDRFDAPYWRARLVGARRLL
jgi:cell wall-associated NlpC family hydrolase